MFDFLLFFLFIFLSILDVSLISRFSFLGAFPLFSLAAIIYFCGSGRKFSIFWIAIPSAIFSLYSQINIIFIILLFSLAYFSAKFLGERFNENKNLRLAVKSISSAAAFSLGYSIIYLVYWGGIEKNFQFYLNLAFKNVIFILAEVVIFWIINLIVKKASNM